MNKSSAWGEGLASRHHLRGRLQLRRNSLVHEAVIILGRLRITIVLHRVAT